MPSISVLTFLLICFCNLRQEATGFVFDTVNSGKPAPPMPEEFVTNFMQHKWDQDGFGVSHIATGVIWHSFSRKLIRVDSAQHDWISNNATIRGPRAGSIQISIFNFTRTDGMVENTIFNARNFESSSCNQYELPLSQSSMQLFSETFLNDTNAGFAGEETLPTEGLCDKWTYFQGRIIPVTLYFNSHGKFIRTDFTTWPPLKASVVTTLFNMDTTPGAIADEVFENIRC